MGSDFKFLSMAGSQIRLVCLLRFYKERDGKKYIFQYTEGRVDKSIGFVVFWVPEVVLTVYVQEESTCKI